MIISADQFSSPGLAEKPGDGASSFGTSFFAVMQAALLAVAAAKTPHGRVIAPTQRPCGRFNLGNLKCRWTSPFAHSALKAQMNPR